MDHLSIKKDLPHLIKALQDFEKPEKKLSSAKSKTVYQAAISFYRLRRRIINRLKNYASEKKEYLPCILARHQSLLHKKLGDNNEHLQKQKVKNLAIAIQKLDGVIIQPGQSFSYWNLIGKPDVKEGYVEGMLLARGKVVAGVGGGLCQLSNLLYWLFLHVDTEILERYHHSYDVFPDSGRVLPFGSGATVFYNYVDLVVRNFSSQPLQIKLWLTEKHLKGQILSTEHSKVKYSISEKNHYFIKWGKRFFRYNEIYKNYSVEGIIVNSELVTVNFAPVLYETSENILKQQGHEVIVIPAKIKEWSAL